MDDEKTKQRIYKMSFAGVYPLYVAKVERKARTKAEVDEVIRWLTGYSQKQIGAQLEKQTDFETFFSCNYLPVTYRLQSRHQGHRYLNLPHRYPSNWQQYV